MPIAAFIHMIGSMGLFPSRAFIPAWATAMLLRFGPEIDGLKDSWLLASLGTPPAWFVHDITLIVLGILALLEIIATKNQEVRDVLNELDQYYKPALAALVTLGILGAADAEIVKQIHAGFGDWFLAMLVGAGVFFLTTLRGHIMGFLRESDEDDDLGVQGLIAWIEDLWATFGLLLLVFYPLFMLGIVALVSGGLFAFRKWIEVRERTSMIPCAACGEKIFPSARQCPKCRAARAEPAEVGFFGGSKPYPTRDPAGHPFRLVEKKRCPVCATRFAEHTLRQSCAACGHDLAADAPFAQRYAERVAARLPKALGISFLFSLIPVIGLIPGVIYYRMYVVAPFKRYVPWSIGCLVKWMVRLLVLGLVLLQVVPILGALMVPLMALLEHLTYRNIFMGLVREQIQGSPAAPQPAV